MNDLIEILETPEYRLVERTAPKEPGGKSFVRIEGVLGQADVKNANGRVYPRAILEREVSAFSQRIKAGRGFSQSEHPETPKLGETSIIWTDIRMESDGKVIGAGLIPETLEGKNLAAIYDAGGRPGFSTRGRGDVKRGKWGLEEADIVQENFKLRAIDVVGDPSVHSAETTRVFRESKEQTMDIKTFAELRAKHPELAASLLAEAETNLKEAFEAALESRTEAIREEVRKELGEAGVDVDEASQSETQVAKAALAGIVDLLREAGAIEPNKVLEGEEITALVNQLESRIEELEQDNATLAQAVAEQNAVEAQAEVKEAAKTRAKAAFPKNPALAEALAATAGDIFESVESLEAGFDTLVERFRPTSAPLPSGPQGRQHVGRGQETAPIVTPPKTKKLEESTDDPDDADEASGALADFALGRRR